MRNSNVLVEYIPQETIADIVRFIEKHNIVFKITNARKTKLGDYRSPYLLNKNHTITINGNLSKYTFLLVCLHEFAHLNVWLVHKHKVPPHGEEWKTEFKRFVNYYLKNNIFPKDLAIALEKHMRNPSATMVTDRKLLEVLQKYNPNINSNTVFLANLPLNSNFELGGRNFQILEKIRTRYKCKSLDNNKIYLVSANAMVKPLN